MLQNRQKIWKNLEYIYSKFFHTIFVGSILGTRSSCYLPLDFLTTNTILTIWIRGTPLGVLIKSPSTQLYLLGIAVRPRGRALLTRERQWSFTVRCPVCLVLFKKTVDQKKLGEKEFFFIYIITLLYIRRQRKYGNIMVRHSVAIDTLSFPTFC